MDVPGQVDFGIAPFLSKSLEVLIATLLRIDHRRPSPHDPTWFCNLSLTFQVGAGTSVVTRAFVDMTGLGKRLTQPFWIPFFKNPGLRPCPFGALLPWKRPCFPGALSVLSL